MSFKLLTETPARNEEFEYIVEEKNTKEPSTMYIRGPYMGAETVNKNKRIYPLQQMKTEVDRYVTEMVKTQRAIGELNHPASADVNPERACHVVTEMWQDGNVFYGKSKVLSTPMGQILRSLINDGVRVGMSSRALGKLEETNNGVSKVTDMRLVAVDCVADPSFNKAFVNGILESKQYVLGNDGDFAEVYDKFEKSISNLPKKAVESFLMEQVLKFINNIKNKL